MLALQTLLLYFATLFAIISADVRYDNLKFEIFDNRPSQFEKNVYDSLQTTKKVFVIVGINGANATANFAPFVGRLVNIAPAAALVLADDSDWHAAFSKTIANEAKREDAEADIRRIEETLQTVKAKVELLDDAHNPSAENQRTIASIIHTQLDIILNAFGRKNSLLKKYALIAAPPLIHLSSLIATFTPLARSLIPVEMNRIDLSCKVLDNLRDYRSRAVSDRLDKIHSENSDFTPAKLNVQLWPYNRSGYNKSRILPCRKDCGPTPYYLASTCMTDDFGAIELEANPQRTRRIKPEINDACWEGYTSFVRHKVEEMFPVELLDSLCKREKPSTNGLGWFTIKIGRVVAHGKKGGGKCDVVSWIGHKNARECDPYVKLFVNGVNVIEPPIEKRTDVKEFNANLYYTSQKILKTSRIKIEVRDDDETNESNDDLILDAEGDVNSFLNHPFRTVSFGGNLKNSVETKSFWLDAYE